MEAFELLDPNEQRIIKSVDIYPLGYLQHYHFVVIFSRYENKWLYCRAKTRDSYETAGGHIDEGETPLEAAKRELYEETGAQIFEIEPAFDYCVCTDKWVAHGQVFFADVKKLGTLPDYEMAEILCLDAMPEKKSYPEILPILYEKIQEWRNLQSAKEEIWDVYDADRNPTGRKHRRIDPLAKGDYHLVVHVWLQNSNGEFLITKRSPNKGYPNMWECTGGSAIAGDDSITAAIREVKEETGLDIQSSNGKRWLTIQRKDSFIDIWLFQQEFDLNKVILQEGETVDAMVVTANQIQNMIKEGSFIHFRYIEDMFGQINKKI